MNEPYSVWFLSAALQIPKMEGIFNGFLKISCYNFILNKMQIHNFIIHFVENTGKCEWKYI